MNIKSRFLFIIFFAASAYSFAQTKHALIVAIGNYPDPETNKWQFINSANDIPLIKNVLIKSQKFNEKNVQVLQDSMATKKGIIDAMNKLLADVKKGDIAVIHFSSHGQQLEDNNNDEVDGFDEAIVPYGASFSFDSAKYKILQAEYLRDDEFGEMITRIRNKLGKEGDVLVVMDACHSGTGARGITTAKIRGGNKAMVSSDINASKFKSIDNVGVFKEKESSGLNTDAATFVLISGAQASESNYECLNDEDKWGGSLSYAFSKAISALQDKITYRGLFAMIENIMLDRAPNQRPALEGDGINRKLFGGNIEKQQPYFSINTEESREDLIVVNGGYVSGITTGSVIYFYDPGTTSTVGKKPVGSGKVISATSFTCTVKPDSIGSSLAAKNSWAFIKEISYGNQKIKLSVPENKVVDKMIRDGLKGFELVEFNSNCDLYLDTAGSINNWALKYPNSAVLFKEGFSFSGNQNMASLRSALKKFDRFRYLKGLSTNDSLLQANVQFIFMDDNGNVDSAKLKTRMPFGRLELREGDQLYLQITNTGKKELYVNIVDIQPDGEINPVLPNKKAVDKNSKPSEITMEDCRVYVAKSIRYPVTIQRPFGEETFKVFLSTSPINLEDILTSKDEQEAAGKRGVLKSLEKLFVNSNVNEAGKRGVTVVGADNEENGTIFSVNFKILPKL